MIDIYNGDCINVMDDLIQKGVKVDLVVTSPPYAERRKKNYNSIPSNEYVEWFLPIAERIKKLLKPSGSFFLNIKTHTHDGERDLYVMELIIAIKRELGFRYVDEFCWTKNAFPGAHKGRFKNGFEPVYHFTLSKPSLITFNPLACGTPMKEESIARTFRKQCDQPENGSGMTGMNTTNIRNLKLARPSNVIQANNVSNQFMKEKSKHPATYPEKLVEFFVKSFTNEGDVVLDPFMGSATTGVVAKKLNRDFIGIELDEEYFELSKGRLEKE